MLQSLNFPSQFVVDQGRSGVIGIRTAEGDWCNVKGAGLGMQPTTDTGNTLIDAIVWGEIQNVSNS